MFCGGSGACSSMNRASIEAGAICSEAGLSMKYARTHRTVAEMSTAAGNVQ
jgi:hypothetical protein